MPTARETRATTEPNRRRAINSVRILAHKMQAANHTLFVTGAGVSTNAHIRDYRGPDGIYTAAVKAGRAPEAGPTADGPTVWDPEMYRRLPAARPTYTHRAIALLVEHGLVQAVVTQNEDGLHLRSGLPPHKLSELHGNAFIEICGSYASGDSDSDLGSSSSSSSSSGDEDESAERAAKAAARAEARRLRPAGCGALVRRNFVTYFGDTYLASNPAGRHVTGRACPRCRGEPGSDVATAGGGGGGGVGGGGGGGGDAPRSGRGWLLDTTVDFGEAPGGFPWGVNPVHNVAAAKAHMQQADLVVVWGSTLSVLANYFDPWRPGSKWAKPAPGGLRKAPPPPGARGKRRKPAPCELVIVSRGEVHDEKLASLKIEADVDEVSEELLRLLGLPPPPPYTPSSDPLLEGAVPVFPSEPTAPWTFASAEGGRAEAQHCGSA